MDNPDVKPNHFPINFTYFSLNRKRIDLKYWIRKDKIQPHFSENKDSYVTKEKKFKYRVKRYEGELKMHPPDKKMYTKC